MANLTTLLGQFSDHFEFHIGQDETEGQQLYGRLGLIDGLTPAEPIATLLLDFCFEHQNIVFKSGQPVRGQLYNRLGLVDNLVAASVTPSTRLPYIAISLNLGMAP